MLPSRIVGAIDEFEDLSVGLPALMPYLALDPFSLDRFEEGFEGRVVLAIAFAAHRYLEAILAQKLLVIEGAFVATSIGLMNAPLDGSRTAITIFSELLSKVVSRRSSCGGLILV